MIRVVGHGELMDPLDEWDSTGRKVMLYTEVGCVLAMSDGVRALVERTEPRYQLTTRLDTAKGRYYTRDMKLSPLTKGQLARMERALGSTGRPDIHVVDAPTTLSALATGTLRDNGSLYLVACAPELDDEDRQALQTDTYEKDLTRWSYLQVRRLQSLASAVEHMKSMRESDLHIVCTGDHQAEAIRREWKISQAAPVTADPTSWTETLEILFAGGEREVVKLLKVWQRNDLGFPDYGKEPLLRLKTIVTSNDCPREVKEAWDVFTGEVQRTRKAKRKRKEPTLPSRPLDPRPFKKSSRFPDPSKTTATPRTETEATPPSWQDGQDLLAGIRASHRRHTAPLPTWSECVDFLKNTYPPHAVPAYPVPSTQQGAGAHAGWQPVQLEVVWDKFEIQNNGFFDDHAGGYLGVLYHSEGGQVKPTPCVLKVAWNEQTGHSPYIELPQN